MNNKFFGNLSCCLQILKGKFFKVKFISKDDFIDKDFVYISKAKVKQFFRKDEKMGMGATISVPPVSLTGSATSRKKTLLEELAEVDKFLKEKDRTHDAVEGLERGNYFHVYLVAAAGTFWPWGDPQKTEIKDTAWWIGEGEVATVLACGKLAHILKQGDIPNLDKSTWWPSRTNAYRDLVDSLVEVSSDNFNNVDIATNREVSLKGLLEYCFNKGVLRGKYVEEPAIYEMLLRVDMVEEHEGGKPVVAGSPVWVARVIKPLPGIYLLAEDAPDEVTGVPVQYHRISDDVDNNDSALRIKSTVSEPVAYGVWNGKKWVETYWGERGDYKTVYDLQIDNPKIPDSSFLPKSTSARGLGTSKELINTIHPPKKSDFRKFFDYLFS